MTALYTPIWITPHRYPAQRPRWKGHIDTGSPLTIAGGRLAHGLLGQHIRNEKRPPTYERIYSATNHFLTVAPIDSIVKVPLSVPVSDETPDPTSVPLSADVRMLVYAAIESEEEAGQQRAINLKDWGTFDVLVGMDLLSQFKLTIDGGAVQFDPPTVVESVA